MDDPFASADDGHTPLDVDDRQGLIPTYISIRGELFDAEQRNIAAALRRRPPPVDSILDDRYLRELHGSMFSEVWTWAGQYRTRTTNLGLAFELIPGAVRDVVRDVRAWIESSVYEIDEIAVRFHHRLVVIHPFVNGNGRHSRIAADFLVVGLGKPRFTWGAGISGSTDDLRRSYLSALRSGDAGDMTSLIAFSRQ